MWTYTILSVLTIIMIFVFILVGYFCGESKDESGISLALLSAIIFGALAFINFMYVLEKNITVAYCHSNAQYIYNTSLNNLIKEDRECVAILNEYESRIRKKNFNSAKKRAKIERAKGEKSQTKK